MALILSIETGTDICSVCVARDGIALESIERQGRDHASQLAPLVEELLQRLGLTMSDIDAVAVGMGPGSYTGLRIGASLAKGLCYGANIPLLAIGSLDALAAMAIEQLSGEGASAARFIPMIDARRMEVYMATFNSCGERESEVEARVIEQGTMERYNDGVRTIIFGNGAEKCREVLPWAEFIEVKASARGMAQIAERKFCAGESEDVAYFEPFYLKEFQVIPSKKRLF